jgi:hypothetical protein
MGTESFLSVEKPRPRPVFSLAAEGGGPQPGVKLERPQRSEDERA